MKNGHLAPGDLPALTVRLSPASAHEVAATPIYSSKTLVHRRRSAIAGFLSGLGLRVSQWKKVT